MCNHRDYRVMRNGESDFDVINSIHFVELVII